MTLASNACSPKKQVVVSKEDNDQVIFKIFRYINLYLVDFNSKDANLRHIYSPKSPHGWLWHRRFALVEMSTLKELLNKEMVRGLKELCLRRISFVVNVKLVSKLSTLIQLEVLCQHRDR